MDECTYTLHAITKALNKVGIGPEIGNITKIED
jgi:hypothetical protein